MTSGPPSQRTGAPKTAASVQNDIWQLHMPGQASLTPQMHADDDGNPWPPPMGNPKGLTTSPESTLAWSTHVRRLAHHVRAVAHAAVELIYPPVCIACGRGTERAHALCPHCWNGMTFIERPFCERLGTPFAVDYGNELLSPAAMADPPVFARARAVARHEGTARELVHKLKYGDRIDLAKAMGTMMCRAGAELLANADVIVPVPLHRGRLWSRRFNQSMALATVLAKASGRQCNPFLLARIKATAHQTGLTRAQRGDNLQGAFRVPDEMKPGVAGQHVLLIDDVLTTGATLNAASRALLRGGATAVDVLTFTRVVVGG